jgi:hypothetical protein
VSIRDALESGDLDGIGALLSQHRTLNKRMGPGCTNPSRTSLYEEGPIFNRFTQPSLGQHKLPCVR